MKRLLTLLTLVLTFGAARAAAQLSAATDPRPEFLARQIARLALLDLRATSTPDAGAYRLAALLLGLAREYTPENPDLLRKHLLAAANAGDEAAVLDLSRELLRLDPKDTMAQLRLITASIRANAQFAEDRVKMYEDFLGPRGRVLDPSVLSRLALDCALLLREQGDDRGFIQKLTLATQLDATHKEAAALAAAVFAERRPDDAPGRLAMLENLLMADPIDPNVHASIARELAAGGAYKGALRFQQNSLKIIRQLGAPTDDAEEDAMVLRWQSEGPRAVIELLNRDLAQARDQAARTIRRLMASGQPTTDAPKPEDIRLTPAFNLIYVMANDAAGDTVATRAAVEEMAQRSNLAIATLRDPNKRGSITDEQARAAILDQILQIETVRLWTNVDVEETRRNLTESGDIIREVPEAQAILEGWLAIRSNEAEKGIEMLRPYADTSLLSAVAIGVGYEALGQADLAKEAYRKLVAVAPMEIAGAWSRTRLKAMGADADPELAAALEAAAAKIPDYIDHMVTDPSRFVRLRVELLQPSPDGLDRAGVRVTLENRAPIPLALGADRALNSRLFFAPKLENFIAGPIDLVRPEIVDVDHRLRLMPRESITVEAWPDLGQCGWLMEALANRSVRLRWRVIQGFVNDPKAGFRPGPMCLSTETEAVVRRPLPDSNLTPEGLAAEVAKAPEVVLMRLAATARAMCLQPLLAPGMGVVEGPPMGAEGIKPVAQAFAARYPTLSLIDRAILVVTLPHLHLAPGMAAFEQTVRADPDPVIRILVLLTRASEVDDPLLAEARNSDDPRLRAAAELFEQRLASSTMYYSRLGRQAATPEGQPPAEGAAPALPPVEGGK